jgi:hypothetical protein
VAEVRAGTEAAAVAVVEAVAAALEVAVATAVAEAVAPVGVSSSLSSTGPSRATGEPITLSREAPSMTATTTSSTASLTPGR